jgi:hypothetical protein
VIERLVENWLDNSSERAFQGPFCSMLSAEGYTVVHLSRHCGMELGKDVIAVAPDGTPCAYQLKTAPSGKITLRQWRDEISKQAFDLVVGRIVHPSIDSDRPHRAYLVTNGMIDEEVARAIDDMNRNWLLSGQAHLRLETIVRGQLLEMAKGLDTSLWPSELAAVQKLLELYLTRGDEIFPKAGFAALLEETLPFEEQGSDAVPSLSSCIRAISSAALICALATSKFSNSNNYVAEIEAWTVYGSYVFALATKYNLADKAWKPSLEIALAYIYNRLEDLADEVKSRANLLEGNPFGDQPFLRARRTWLAGLMGCLGLWRRSANCGSSELEVFLLEFCRNATSQLHVWGEAAVPQCLSLYWFLRITDATCASDDLVFALLSHLAQSNGPQGKTRLPDPYYSITDVLGSEMGIGDKPITDDFGGASYTLEALVHLYARLNWKQHMKLLWPQITYVAFESYVPAKPWLFFFWRDKDGSASVTIVQPTHTLSWAALCEAAEESSGGTVPERAKSYPVFVLLFLIVFPHRLTADVARWLDRQLIRGGH